MWIAQCDCVGGQRLDQRWESHSSRPRPVDHSVGNVGYKGYLTCCEVVMIGMRESSSVGGESQEREWVALSER